MQTDLSGFSITLSTDTPNEITIAPFLCPTTRSTSMDDSAFIKMLRISTTTAAEEESRFTWQHLM
ncbi:hypothetical protein [Streptomyces sp. NPDC056549]|uniref:hypothetical protein n=1 Tax=Streptomyces sp. NPDC056549 TaxID=3345864 RepID=UPI0036A2CB1B